MTPPIPPQKSLGLAIVAVYNLLRKFDLELLQYLDINREQLLQVYLSQHTPIEYTSLNKLDREAVDSAMSDMLGYIKVITCVHHQEKQVIHRQRSAESEVIAEMEEAQARTSMTAINDSIKQNAATLPKDNQQLGDAVNKIVDHRDAHVAKRKARQQKAKATTASKRQKTQPVKGAANRKNPPASGRRAGNGKPHAKPPQKPHPTGNDNNSNKKVQWKRTGNPQKRNPKGTHSTQKGKK
jgi:hypothetical protein